MQSNQNLVLNTAGACPSAQPGQRPCLAKWGSRIQRLIELSSTLFDIGLEHLVFHHACFPSMAGLALSIIPKFARRENLLSLAPTLALGLCRYDVCSGAAPQPSKAPTTADQHG